VYGIRVPLLASLMILLSRYSGQSDIVVGCVLPQGSPSQAAKQTVARPVRCGVDPHANAAALFSRLDAALSAGRRHASAADASMLQDVLQMPRSLNHNPLYQVLMSVGRPDEPMMDARPAVDACDLALLLEDAGETIQGVLSFAHDLFDAATATRMAAQWVVTLESLLENPDRPLEELEVLAREDREQLLSWNATAVRFPTGTLAEFLSAQAARTPDADAVVDGDRRLSYRELQQMAARVADSLAALQIGRQDVVGIALSPGIETFIAAWGVLSVGGLCVPLDPDWPDARIAAVLADAAPKLIVTEAGSTARLPGPWPRWQLVSLLSERPAPNGPLAGSSPEDVALLIYSGEGGAKLGCGAADLGVALTHANLINLAFARNRLHDPVGPGDRIMLCETDTVSADLVRQLLPLLSGACVVIPPTGSASAAQVWERIVTFGVSHLHATPAWLEPRLDAATRQPGLRLRRVVLRGPDLTHALCCRIHDTLPEARIVQVYGTPETSFETLAQIIDPPLEREAGIVPLGRPLANCRAYVLDERLRYVPVGVEGGLFLGGMGVARGYLGHPAETSARFPADLCGGPDARMFATQARACWRADGTLLWLGHAPRDRGEEPEPAVRAEAGAEVAAEASIDLAAARMARRLEQLSLQFNPQGTLPPLFCVQAPAADLDAWLHVAPLVDASIPVCGLVASAWHESAVDPLEQRLKRYERQMRDRQPKGPYRLCGIRQSGAEAFELAQQLEDSGESVLLLLIDAYPPPSWQSEEGWLPRLWHRLRTTPVSGGPLHRLCGRVVLIESARDYQGSQPEQGYRRWRSFVRGRIHVIPLPTARELLTQQPAVALAVRHINQLLTS
jgi:non-ribosomal peptide synthetase component F